MEFWKMHGLGNDFILMEGRQFPVDMDYSQLARRLCDRHAGIGADGIEIVLPSQKADIRMRIINSDGSEAEMCGNGIRCFAKFVYERDLVSRETMTVETLAGFIRPELKLVNGHVSAVKVDMGQPVLDRARIPMAGPAGPVVAETLGVGDRSFTITSLLIGVPHTVIFVENLRDIPVAEIGPAIERHPSFPKRTNVNFVEVINQQEIAVRTWERGAGATLACGTGCCAAVVASILNRKTVNRVTVHLQLGDLQIEWFENQSVCMTGPAVEVFRGIMELGAV